MKGKVWLIVGVLVGIAVGVGKVPYFSGAASSFSDTAQRVVGSGALTIVHSAAHHGASRRVVEGAAAVLSVLVPGITALLLVIAARATLRLRSVIAIVLITLGAASFAYLPHGTAFGVLLLAFLVVAIAVVATGPLVAAPLAALASLIATVFLPHLLSTKNSLPNSPVNSLHEAIFATAGAPLWLRIVVLVIAALPFALGARLILR